MSKKIIINKLATKYNLPLRVITKIVDHQFKFVGKIMKEGNFDAIRLPYFGKFSAKKKRIEYIKKKSNDTTK